jgi:Ca2+/H+ antiporter, TMEM165/GDT1 family
MIRNKVGRVVAFAVLAVVFLVLFGYAVMSLWNWLMPTLFGLHVITYWQAVGILILSKLLFGGFRGGRGGHRGHWGWRRRMMERWEQMTPEEREKFREGMRNRCGPFRATEPKV